MSITFNKDNYVRKKQDKSNKVFISTYLAGIVNNSMDIKISVDNFPCRFETG